MMFAEKIDMAINIVYIVLCVTALFLVALCFSGGEIFLDGAGIHTAGFAFLVRLKYM